MKYLKRVILQDKKLSLLTLLFIIAIPFALAFITSSSLNPYLQSQNDEIIENMRNSQITDGMDPAINQEINRLLIEEKYQEAQQKIETVLERDDLLDKDKKSLYASLAQACASTQDFKCVDKVIGQYGTFLEFDYFYLNDAAELAVKTKNQAKAKEYYRRLLTEIDNQGGKDFVDTLNKDVVKQLDYEQIKKGAGNA